MWLKEMDELSEDCNYEQCGCSGGQPISSFRRVLSKDPSQSKSIVAQVRNEFIILIPKTTKASLYLYR